ncbi:hypothetical protein M513_03401 [Trichuris suis]|uniref:MARVEL domain-containing protein n=1 Tax=Trichuris suis TaxID=68888 RepID=A0A085MEK7_9BILA|nr:hypothetical protein M513_03401 [Trichuris suis]
MVKAVARLSTTFPFVSSLRQAWLKQVLCIVLVTLIEAGVHLWRAYGFILFVSAACAAITFAGLALKFCQIQTGRVGSFPFDKVDLTFNIFAVICFSIAFGLACYDCVMIFGENKHHHDNQPTSLAAYEDWRNRIVGVTNGIRRGRHKERADAVKPFSIHRLGPIAPTDTQALPVRLRRQK